MFRFIDPLEHFNELFVQLNNYHGKFIAIKLLLMRLLTTLIFSLYGLVVFAQVDVSFYGVHTTVPAYSIKQGWGGGMNMFSHTTPLAVGKKAFPIQMQIGGGFVLASAGNRTFRDVTFNARPDEDAKLHFTNMHYGIHAMTRFSTDRNAKNYAPYVDLFAGLRGVSSTVTVYYPDSDNAYYDETVASTWNVGYGAGAGVLIRVGNASWIDAGVQWQSIPQAKVIDMNSVSSADGIAYSTISTPPGTLMFKLGFVISAGTKNCCGVAKCGVAGHHNGPCKVAHE